MKIMIEESGSFRKVLRSVFLERFSKADSIIRSSLLYRLLSKAACQNGEVFQLFAYEPVTLERL